MDTRRRGRRPCLQREMAVILWGGWCGGWCAPQEGADGRATKSREKMGNAPAAGVVNNGKEKEVDGEEGSCVCRGRRPPSCGGRLFL